MQTMDKEKETGWGGKRNGAGRKKMPEDQKITYQTISVTARKEQIAELKIRAQNAGLTVSRYLMQMAGL